MTDTWGPPALRRWARRRRLDRANLKPAQAFSRGMLSPAEYKE